MLVYPKKVKKNVQLHIIDHIPYILVTLPIYINVKVTRGVKYPILWLLTTYIYEEIKIMTFHRSL